MGLMSESLYDRIGGEAAIMAAVERFYQKVLVDERTRPFFENLDMTDQTKKQIAFMTWAFGGPNEFKGRDLRAAHAPLVAKGLGDVQFDAVASHLETTLQELGVPEELVRESLAIVAGTREEVLGR
jgi:hemoglobin